MYRTTVVACLFALLFGFCVASAKANEANEATKITFNNPVEIPGRVLKPGTYWFTILRDDPNQNVVQVWNSTRQHLLDTVLSIPDYRTHTPSHTIIKFEERASNSPEALRAWFYPGQNYGHAFVYSETEARDLAKRTGHPVLSMRDDIASNSTKPAKSANDASVVAMKNANVKAMNSNGQEVDKSQAIQAEPNQTSASRR
ncbi:MAG TPA: hypothetical protein VMP68_13190 [Candidatus Eisenbacteria bacterium]|nr:hypothetical protein [Candidatus Eisenbacteria bacterium]